MEEIIIPIMIVGMLFIGLPWLVLHYVTRWKSNNSLTSEDEKLLDELYDLARRLDDRMHTIERIMADENPNWRPLNSENSVPRLERAEVHELGARLAKERAPIRSQSSDGRI